eukprot:Tbor_TRINITY_DN4034_c0_g1::TRINITY_DN4034_c0_g1_i1::g.11700::m.11700
MDFLHKLLSGSSDHQPMTPTDETGESRFTSQLASSIKKYNESMNKVLLSLEGVVASSEGACEALQELIHHSGTSSIVGISSASTFRNGGSGTSYPNDTAPSNTLFDMSPNRGKIHSDNDNNDTKRSVLGSDPTVFGYKQLQAMMVNFREQLKICRHFVLSDCTTGIQSQCIHSLKSLEHDLAVMKCLRERKSESATKLKILWREMNEIEKKHGISSSIGPPPLPMPQLFEELHHSAKNRSSVFDSSNLLSRSNSSNHVKVTRTQSSQGIPNNISFASAGHVTARRESTSSRRTSPSSVPKVYSSLMVKYESAQREFVAADKKHDAAVRELREREMLTAGQTSQALLYYTSTALGSISMSLGRVLESTIAPGVILATTQKSCNNNQSPNASSLVHHHSAASMRSKSPQYPPTEKVSIYQHGVTMYSLPSGPLNFGKTHIFSSGGRGEVMASSHETPGESHL